MVSIFAGILSLVQHLNVLEENPEKYRLESCPHCGKAKPWHWGFRFRKADREKHEEKKTGSLNPIPIQRFYCSTCKQTCSLLPECISPHRWYLWLIQQAAMQLFFSGVSFNKISQTLAPSRWTISRWIKRSIERFAEHTLHLKAKWAELGYHTSFNEFWSALLTQWPLSQAMHFLNDQGVIIP